MKLGTEGFHGERLTEAREARGLTQTSLAELLVLTRQQVSQYEKNKNTPSSDVFDRLSKVLAFPHEFFLSAPPEEEGDDTVFYRSMSAATKTARQKAEHRLTWLKQITRFCSSYIQLPPVDIPSFDIPTNPLELSDQDIEELAKETRRYWHLSDGIISNLILLLEQKGVIVARSDLEASTLDALSEWCTKDNRPYIYLSSAKESAARSRFDTAHELGHLIMHRHLNKKMLTKPAEFKAIEYQAHRFASAFLLPAETFSRKLVNPSLNAFLKLKEEANLSIAMMIKRSQDLEIIDEYETKRLFINYSRRGWKRGEPLDDQVLPEGPRLLQKIITLLVNEKIITKKYIKSELPYRPSDICQLVNLNSDYLDYEQCIIQEFPEITLKPDAASNKAGKVIPFKKS